MSFFKNDPESIALLSYYYDLTLGSSDCSAAAAALMRDRIASHNNAR